MIRKSRVAIDDALGCPTHAEACPHASIVVSNLPAKVDVKCGGSPPRERDDTKEGVHRNAVGHRHNTSGGVCDGVTGDGAFQRNRVD